jgi:glycerophosphoryl diester phosphodiesterase
MAAFASQAQPRILVHGHRGARAVRPENTMPAFEYAIQQGVDVLELDLAVTKDNHLVVSHDEILPPAICDGPQGATRVIREMTLTELRKWDCGAKRNPGFPQQQPVPGTHVPTLEEVLALASKGSFEFNIETKIEPDKPQFTPEPEVFAKLLVDAIRRHKLETRVIIQSFDFRTLHAAAKLAPELRRSALYAGIPKDLVALTKGAEATICSPYYRLATASQVDALHKANFQVVPWTANTPADWDRLIAAGVDAIITDDPAALIAHLKSKGLR